MFPEGFFMIQAINTTMQKISIKFLGETLKCEQEGDQSRPIVGMESSFLGQKAVASLKNTRHQHRCTCRLQRSREDLPDWVQCQPKSAGSEAPDPGPREDGMGRLLNSLGTWAPHLALGGLAVNAVKVPLSFRPRSVVEAAGFKAMVNRLAFLCEFGCQKTT